MKKNILLLILISLTATSQLFAQDAPSSGRLSGNFQLDAQYYGKDSIIGAKDVPPEKIRSNAFINLLYKTDNFDFGVRFESYQNPMLGFNLPSGSAIPFKYVSYSSEYIDVTGGDFYEQFGSGIIFRSYEDRQLGFDNSVQGFRFKLRPAKGISFTGLIGNQRNSTIWDVGKGILRAGDLNITVNDLIENMIPGGLYLTLGASIVSKYEKDQSITYNMPQNVLAYSARFNLNGEHFSLDGEYGHKNNDPNFTNLYNYNPGQGFILSGSYFVPGLGINLNFHRIDNMDFHSEASASGNYLNVNFIPPLTKQYGYRLATIYPYATQLNGEVGAQAEITIAIPKETFFGGEHGADIAINYSRVQAIDTSRTMFDKPTGNAFLYDSPFFSIGKRLYFQDFNLEYSRKFGENLKTVFSYINSTYDKDALTTQGGVGYGKVFTNIIVGEFYIKLTDEHSLKIEAQHLWFEQQFPISTHDNTNGNWAMLLAEYTIAPAYYISLFDEYNYGNDYKDYQIHYPGIAFAYVHEATRVSLGYSRQRQGILCVGGVCRQVPASNGLLLSVTSSF
ncbi:MAG: hypothetical protein HW421_2707 [Ignavibacteria bacterium]|nr:hypothetical protein [Ignavibacteria bacterium]